MIPRYTRPQMAALWEPEARYRAWLDVELLACEANAKLGLIPPKALATIKKRRPLTLRASTSWKKRSNMTSSRSSPR